MKQHNKHHQRLRRSCTNRVQQDGGCCVMAHSPAGPEMSFPPPNTLTTEQALASAPPAIHMQAKSNYHAEQQAITKGFSVTVFKKDANY